MFKNCVQAVQAGGLKSVHGYTQVGAYYPHTGQSTSWLGTSTYLCTQLLLAFYRPSYTRKILGLHLLNFHFYPLSTQPTTATTIYI